MKILRKMLFTLVVVFSLMNVGVLAHAQMVDGQQVVIPYATTINGWWTGFAIFNRSGETREVSVLCLDEFGEFIGTYSANIRPLETAIATLDSFISELKGKQKRVNITFETVGTDPFYVTMFMGNVVTSGFSFFSYKSELIAMDDDI